MTALRLTPHKWATLDAYRLKLIDSLIEETDPAALASMDTRSGRGIRQQQKVDAIKTADLIERIEERLGLRSAAAGSELMGDGDEEITGDELADDDDIERLIREAGLICDEEE